MYWFDYAVIKYLPNPKRGEILNIGIIIFRSSGVDVRLLRNSSKLRMFDGESLSHELDALGQAIEGLCALTENKEEQIKILNDFASGVHISNLANFSISTTQQYEPIVNRLFNELVKPLSIREPRVNNSRLYTQIKQQLRNFEILADDPSDIYEHKVVSSFPLGTNSGLAADFMLKNGRYHMSEVIDFNVIDTNAKFKETTMKVMTFLEGKRVLDENMGCYLIYSASASKEKEITPHLNLASDYSDNLYNFYSEIDRAAYFQKLADLTGRELSLQ
jgi:hypothetical protein